VAGIVGTVRIGRPSATDLAVTVAVTILQAVAPRAGGSVDPVPVWRGVLDLLLVLGQGGGLLWRRRSPEPATLLVVAGYLGQAALMGAVAPFAPWLALFGLTAAGGGRRATAVLAGATAGVAAALAIGAVGHPASATGLPLLVVLTGAVLLGGALRHARAARAQALRDQQTTEERLRIARDLHDLVGHGLSTIAVQSSTARLALDAGQPETARTALAAVESSSRAALQEMRQLLSVLRGGSGSSRPAPGLPDIPELVERVRVAGVPVGLHLPDDDAGGAVVPEAVQLAAYRIVQESLTNVLKHSPGSRADVRLARTGETLTVEVADADGRPAASAGPPGTGLTGLRERVDALGGTLRTGPRADGTGWSVTAQLPLGGGDAGRMP
jgi:signal transduction histidine kinase